MPWSTVHINGHRPVRLGLASLSRSKVNQGEDICVRVRLASTLPLHRRRNGLATRFHAYTDETGNTGSHIFSAPPHFWTCTLLSPVDLDTTLHPYIKQWSRNLNASELHANELGLGRIESFAHELADVLRQHECQVMFTRIEKAHVGRLKFADTILDSGLNPAVSSFHYGTRFFRLSLSFAIATQMSPQSLEEWWEAYRTQDVRLFKGVSERVLWNVRTRIKDSRMRELLSDALEWARKYPDSLLTHRRDDYDSPNMVAFSLLITCLNVWSLRETLHVVRFVHDQQNQFAKHLKFMYEHLKGHSPSNWSSATSYIADLVEAQALQSELEIVESGRSPGLQAVDVLLWLTKRHVENGEITAPNSRSLIDWAYQTGTLSEFSYQSHAQEVQAMMAEVMNLPFDPEAEERGRAFQAELEQRRKQAMNNPYK